MTQIHSGTYNKVTFYENRDIGNASRSRSRGSRSHHRDYYKKVMKLLIEKGLQSNVGGEFGFGGLFNFPQEYHHLRPKLYHKWYLVPKFLDQPELTNETLDLMMDKPILHAAILNNAPYHILLEFIGVFAGRFLCNQDSHGRCAIYVAIKQRIPWPTLKLLLNFIAVKQERSILHIAAEYGLHWDNGMKELMEDEMQHIGKKDSKTGLYPFMLAAIGNGEGTRNCDLTSLFNLMKIHPALIDGQTNEVSMGSTSCTSRSRKRPWSDVEKEGRGTK